MTTTPTASPELPDLDRRVHELKTDPEVFAAVLAGRKTHEIRFNDRGFQVGDELLLRETAHSGAEMAARPEIPLIYTDRTVRRTISHIQTGYGLADGWCILSFARRAQPEGEAPQAEPEPNPSLEDCPEDDQHWAKVDPAVAFHLIERHAEDWADAGRMMLQWHKAMSRAAQLDGGQGENHA